MKERRDQRYQLMQSSSDLGWSNLFAEVRSYGLGEGTHPAAEAATITISLSGSEGTSGSRIGGSWQSAKHVPGRLWVKPRGGMYDEGYTTTSKMVRVLDLHLAASVFAQLSDDYGLPAALDRSVRYVCGAQDEVVYQIGLSVLSEMVSPTAGGRIYVETASRLLADRLLQSHCDANPARVPLESPHRLDDRRLKRVLDYVEAHLLDDFTVADLASVANLSIF